MLYESLSNTTYPYWRIEEYNDKFSEFKEHSLEMKLAMSHI